MIITEIVEINGKELVHNYSDENLYIRKVGTDEIYSEVFDILSAGYTYEETDQQIPFDEENELKLTRGDVFRGLLRAKGITRSQVRAMIEAMPDETQEQALTKELALIDFDEALYFYRRNPLMDKLRVQLGITSAQMTRFFTTNDWHELV